MAEQAYARPEMLVEPTWLEAHVNDANVRIVDCDLQPAYRRAHIPNAIPIKGHHYLKEKEGAPYIMGLQQYTEVMRQMGIGDDTLVIAYDGFSSLYAARFWWTLNYYGHTQVKVLNGGWDAWLTEVQQVSNAPTRPPENPSSFSAKKNEEIIARWEQVRDAIDNDTILLDVRSDGEWTGKNDRGTKRGGHIPNAVHLEWLNYVDPETKKFKSAAELSLLFEDLGISCASKVVTY